LFQILFSVVGIDFELFENNLTFYLYIVYH
jgi:hypothetical protein